MAAQIDIFNRALVILGEERVSSPSQDVKAARELSAVWETTRRALLRGYRWGFAMKRAQLAALASAPLTQFDFQYLLPSDFLRLDFVGDFFVGLSLTDYRTSDESEYALGANASGTVLETNLAAPLSVRYVADLTVTTTYDALFTEALAAKLAVDTGWSLTKSGTAIKIARDAFMASIQAAISVGAIERPPVPTADDSWIMSRL